MRIRPSQREQKAVREAFAAGRAALEMAHQQIGDTPAKRAEWLLRFVETDLAAAPTARLAYQLRALADTLRDSPRTIGLSPMPAAGLRDYQQQLAAGVKAVLAGKEWKLPPVTCVLSGRLWSGHFAIQKHILPVSEGETILLAAAQAIADVNGRIRPCRDPKCGGERGPRPFVAKDARALYCSPKCSMRVRNRQRRDGAKKGK